VTAETTVDVGECCESS